MQRGVFKAFEEEHKSDQGEIERTGLWKFLQVKKKAHRDSEEVWGYYKKDLKMRVQNEGQSLYM